MRIPSGVVDASNRACFRFLFCFERAARAASRPAPLPPSINSRSGRPPGPRGAGACPPRARPPAKVTVPKRARRADGLGGRERRAPQSKPPKIGQMLGSHNQQRSATREEQEEATLWWVSRSVAFFRACRGVDAGRYTRIEAAKMCSGVRPATRAWRRRNLHV